MFQNTGFTEDTLWTHNAGNIRGEANKKIRWFVKKKAKVFLCTPRRRMEGTAMAPRNFSLGTWQR